MRPTLGAGAAESMGWQMSRGCVPSPEDARRIVCSDRTRSSSPLRIPYRLKSSSGAQAHGGDRLTRDEGRTAEQSRSNRQTTRVPHGFPRRPRRPFQEIVECLLPMRRLGPSPLRAPGYGCTMGNVDSRGTGARDTVGDSRAPKPHPRCPLFNILGGPNARDAQRAAPDPDTGAIRRR